MLFILVLQQTAINAQGIDMVSKSDIRKVVTTASRLVAAKYVFPDIGVKMGRHITGKLRQGVYVKFRDPHDFSAQITSDLREISNDRHLWVTHNPSLAQALIKTADAGKGDQGPSDSELDLWRWKNNGFLEARILDGNVGYLDIRDFPHSAYGAETAAGAMRFVSNCRALIIDLRYNGGGWAEMVALLCSYFFDTTAKIPLTSFYDRQSDSIVERTTTTTVLPIPPLPNIPLYILTSGNTFSAAEEFSYNLQQLKRATIVGQRSRGGANNPRDRVINDRFILTVPEGRPINAVTKTNWEGVGVKPDIEVPADTALDRAYRTALDTLLAKAASEADRFKYRWCLEGLPGQGSPVAVDLKALTAYAGEYGPERKVLCEAGEIFYVRGDRPKMRMIPVSGVLFRFGERDDFRIRFNRATGPVESMTLLFDDGREQNFQKTK